MPNLRSGHQRAHVKTGEVWWKWPHWCGRKRELMKSLNSYETCCQLMQRVWPLNSASRCFSVSKDIVVYSRCFGQDVFATSGIPVPVRPCSVCAATLDWEEVKVNVYNDQHGPTAPMEMVKPTQRSGNVHWRLSCLISKARRLSLKRNGLG